VGAHSRRKGAAAEREVVALAKEHGFTSAVRSAPMQCGHGDDFPDVANVGRLHVEVKRRGKGSMYALAVDACRERPGFVPTLAYREDGGPWLAVVPLAELLKLEAAALGLTRPVCWDDAVEQADLAAAERDRRVKGEEPA
jgi:Holliday junction resolvase